MNNMMIIIGAACFALVFNESGIPFTVKRWMNRNRLKPFDCAFCLAWWLGIISSIYFKKNMVEVIYIGATASILAVLLNKKLNA